MDYSTRFDPVTSATLDRIYDASREAAWLPAAMITLLRVPLGHDPSSAPALPSHIARQIHGYLHVPVTRCSAVKEHGSLVGMSITASWSTISIQVGTWPAPCAYIRFLNGDYMGDGAAYLAIYKVFDIGLFGSRWLMYREPFSQTCTADKNLVDAATKIVAAAKWIAECSRADALVCLLAELGDAIRDSRDFSPAFGDIEGHFHAQVSGDGLVVGGPRLCSDCGGTA